MLYAQAAVYLGGIGSCVILDLSRMVVVTCVILYLWKLVIVYTGHKVRYECWEGACCLDFSDQARDGNGLPQV